MPFNINHLTPVLFGLNMSMRAGMRLKEFGCTRVLFIYDQGIKKAGIPDRVIQNVEALGMKVCVYEGVQADPPDYTIEEGAEIGRKEEVDGIVGIGGGSTMDTAKGVNILMGNPSPIHNYMRMGPPIQPGKKLILIPTTSGTGSEVTTMAVITDTTDSNKKKGPAGNNVRASLAIVDPMLTVGMPLGVTADTGMDAFSHAIEAVTSGQANPMSDILGQKAMSLVCKYLPRAVKDGSDIEARENMSFAATCAGFAFNDAITHLGHTIGHTLGAVHHIPHGNACALAMPEIIEFIAEATPDGIRRTATAMGLEIGDSVSARDAGKIVADAIRALNAEIGLKTLKQHNVDKESLKIVAKRAVTEGPAMFSPRKVNSEDLLDILEKAYAR